MTKLGKKLENPYSVLNMNKAWKNLQLKSGTSKDDADSPVKTTHLYVKFKPKNEEELWSLKKDTTLVYYDYPLDYEIPEQGDFYHDPEVPDNQPTYQYVAIPVETTLAENVEYEILEELFIPDDESDESSSSKNGFASKENIYELVDEALQITGNLDSKDGTSLTARSKWRPAGRIRVYDHVVSAYVGVSGAKVSARRWFTTHRGFTNNDGAFSCDGRFRRDANYDIKWDRYEYSIRSGSFFQADYKGPKRRGSWNLDLGNSGSRIVDDKQQYYALVHQAAFDYYYGGRFGLTSPPTNSFLKKQIKIAARTSYPWGIASSFSHTRADLSLGISAQIHVKRWRESSEDVYATTIHELSHGVHWAVSGPSYDAAVFNAFDITDSKLQQSLHRRFIESWAELPALLLTNNRYATRFRIANYSYQDNFQNNTIARSGTYTSIGIDLIDNINQRTHPDFGNNRNTFPEDNVSGYTLRQIERALIGASNVDHWENNLRNFYTNNTENNLAELFDNWREEF